MKVAKDSARGGKKRGNISRIAQEPVKTKSKKA
jgi:hypothetical protein